MLKSHIFLKIVISIFVLILYFRWDLYYSSGFKGYVLDYKTQKPIQGARVTVVWQDYRGASYHGSNHYEVLVSKVIITDKYGRFDVEGWVRMLGKSRYFDNRTPKIIIEHRNYQRYMISMHSPYPTPYLGYVVKVPVDESIPNNKNRYYLKLKDELE